MRKPYVVALEGIPGSGKTTLRKCLNVSQYTIDRVEQILPGDPDSDKDISLDKIIESDLLKTGRANSQNFDIVILDRYYLSTLAYQYAYDVIKKNDTYGPLASIYSEYLKSGKLIRPNITFHIDTPLKESFIRKNRLSGDEMWVTNEFLELNRKYYKEQSDSYAIDGTRPLGDIKLEIEQLIREGIGK